jgi:hypothetical protein
VHGPIHSPGFAPAEWGFSHGITFSQLHEDWLRVHPKEYPQVFAAGLRSITAEYMRAYFADAHFPVPGLPYKPYLGELTSSLGGEVVKFFIGNLAFSGLSLMHSQFIVGLRSIPFVTSRAKSASVQWTTHQRR